MSSTLTATKAKELSEVIITSAAKITEHGIVSQLHIKTVIGDPSYVGFIVNAFCTKHNLLCSLGTTIVINNTTESSESQLTKFLSQNDVSVIIPPMEMSA